MRAGIATPRWILAFVGAAHIAAIWAVARPGEAPVRPAQVLAVTWIEEPAAAPAPPRPQPAEAKPKNHPVQTTSTPTAAPSGEIAGQTATATAAATAGEAPPAKAEAVTAASFDAAYLRNPPPSYPSLSRRLGEQGKVQLRVFVSAEGNPESIEIKASSGFARLDSAAQEAVRRWRFVPARHGDAAVGAWVLVPVNFHLES